MATRKLLTIETDCNMEASASNASLSNRQERQEMRQYLDAFVSESQKLVRTYQNYQKSLVASNPDTHTLLSRLSASWQNMHAALQQLERVMNGAHRETVQECAPQLATLVARLQEDQTSVSDEVDRVFSSLTIRLLSAVKSGMAEWNAAVKSTERLSAEANLINVNAGFESMAPLPRILHPKPSLRPNAVPQSTVEHIMQVKQQTSNTEPQATSTNSTALEATLAESKKNGPSALPAPIVPDVVTVQAMQIMTEPALKTVPSHAMQQSDPLLERLRQFSAERLQFSKAAQAAHVETTPSPIAPASESPVVPALSHRVSFHANIPQAVPSSASSSTSTTAYATVRLTNPNTNLSRNPSPIPIPAAGSSSNINQLQRQPAITVVKNISNSNQALASPAGRATPNPDTIIDTLTANSDNCAVHTYTRLSTQPIELRQVYHNACSVLKALMEGNPLPGTKNSIALTVQEMPARQKLVMPSTLALTNPTGAQLVDLAKSGKFLGQGAQDPSQINKETIRTLPLMGMVPVQQWQQWRLLDVTSTFYLGRSNHKKSPCFLELDSQVVSRSHLEIWHILDQFFIRDVGSNSGTFLNGTRLSPAGTVSNPFEVVSGDIVQLGVDYRSNEPDFVPETRHKCVQFMVILKPPVKSEQTPILLRRPIEASSENNSPASSQLKRNEMSSASAIDLPLARKKTLDETPPIPPPLTHSSSVVSHNEAVVQDTDIYQKKLEEKKKHLEQQLLEQHVKFEQQLKSSYKANTAVREKLHVSLEWTVFVKSSMSATVRNESDAKVMQFDVSAWFSKGRISLTLNNGTHYDLILDKQSETGTVCRLFEQQQERGQLLIENNNRLMVLPNYSTQTYLDTFRHLQPALAQGKLANSADDLSRVLGKRLDGASGTTGEAMTGSSHAELTMKSATISSRSAFFMTAKKNNRQSLQMPPREVPVPTVKASNTDLSATPQPPQFCVSGDFREGRFIIILKLSNSREQKLVGECAKQSLQKRNNGLKHHWSVTVELLDLGYHDILMMAVVVGLAQSTASTGNGGTVSGLI